MNETFTQNQPKKKKSIFKKILIGIGALIAFLILMAILFPLDYYKEGMDAYNKKDYKKAYEYLNNVKPEDKNYSDAIAKINEIKPIVDSLNLAQENAKAEKKAEKENAKLAKAEEKELKEINEYIKVYYNSKTLNEKYKKLNTKNNNKSGTIPWRTPTPIPTPLAMKMPNGFCWLLASLPPL